MPQTLRLKFRWPNTISNEELWRLTDRLLLENRKQIQKVSVVDEAKALGKECEEENRVRWRMWVDAICK